MNHDNLALSEIWLFYLINHTPTVIPVFCVEFSNRISQTTFFYIKLEQIIDILAVECNQISWKLMSSHYLSIKSGCFETRKSSVKQISGQSEEPSELFQNIESRIRTNTCSQIP